MRIPFAKTEGQKQIDARIKEIASPEAYELYLEVDRRVRTRKIVRSATLAATYIAVAAVTAAIVTKKETDKED